MGSPPYKGYNSITLGLQILKEKINTELKIFFEFFNIWISMNLRNGCRELPCKGMQIA